MNPGLIGGIVGCVLGCIGGAIGTWASIRAAQGERERRFIVRCSIVAWLYALVFVALLFLIASPWKHFLWLPHGIFFPIGIIYFNRTQQRLREEEADDSQEGSQE